MARMKEFVSGLVSRFFILAKELDERVGAFEDLHELMSLGPTGKTGVGVCDGFPSDKKVSCVIQDF